MENKSEIAQEKVEAEHLIKVFLADISELTEEDRAIYEPIRKAFALRSQDFRFGGFMSDHFSRHSFEERLRQFKEDPHPITLGSLMRSIPRGADAGLMSQFSKEAGDGLDPKALKLFCDRLKAMGDCWHYFNRTDVFRANPKAQQAQEEQIEKVLVFKGFTENTANDFHTLDLEDRAALAAREFLVEMLFQFFQEHSETATIAKFTDYLTHDNRDTRIVFGLSFHLRNCLHYPSNRCRNSDTYFDVVDKEATSVKDQLLEARSFSEEHMYEIAQSLDLTTLSSRDISLLEIRTDLKRLGLSADLRAAIAQKELQAKDTLWQSPNADIDSEAWQDLVVLRVKAVIPTIAHWHDFLTKTEWDRLDKFKVTAAQVNKDRKEAELAQEVAEREAKREARENDPEEAFKFIAGVIRHELKACQNQDQAVLHVARKLKGEFGGHPSDVVRLAQKHKVNPKSIYTDHAGWLGEHNHGRPKWQDTQRLQWQQVCAVLGLLTEPQAITLPQFLKPVSKASELALDLMRFDKAVFETDLPEGVYDEAVSGQLANFAKVSAKQLEPRHDRPYYLDDGEDGFMADFYKQARNAIPEEVATRRKLYAQTPAAIAWYLAPDFKRVSYLKDYVWQFIRENKLRKEHLLVGFDELISQVQTLLENLETINKNWRLQLTPELLAEYKTLESQDKLGQSMKEMGVEMADDFMSFLEELEGDRSLSEEDNRSFFSKENKAVQVRMREIEALTSMGKKQQNRAQLLLVQRQIEELRSQYERNFVWSQAQREADEQKRRAKFDSQRPLFGTGFGGLF